MRVALLLVLGSAFGSLPLPAKLTARGSEASPEPDNKQVVSRGDPGDGGVERGGVIGGASLPSLRIGNGGDDLHGHGAVFFFALPRVPSGDVITGAELGLQYLGTTKGTPGNFVRPDFNVDLFGLGAREKPTPLGSDYHEGKADPTTGTLLSRAFITPSTATGRRTISNAALRECIASLYLPDGTPIAAYVALRANADTDFTRGTRQYTGYELATANNTESNGSYVPQLKLTLARKPGGPSLQTAPPSAAPTSNAEATTPEGQDAGNLRLAVWVLGILLGVCVVAIVFLVRGRPGAGATPI